VLLVDHHQAQIIKNDLIVEPYPVIQQVWVPITMPAAPETTSSQRGPAHLGPCDPVSRATRVACSAPSSSPGRARGPSGSRYRAVVLLGQDLGGGEQGLPGRRRR
jgi:hypothetical protein